MLVKHALPVLDPAVPPREWLLGAEGEEQARRLAGLLASYAPFRLIASPEPKALRTAQLVAAELRLDVSVAAGLAEFDRPALPLMTKEEHERINAGIFEDLDRPVLGMESGQDALQRFSNAIAAELARIESENLVAVTHGTVISLFVAAHNDIDGFTLWKQLACPAFVVLDIATLAILRIVSTV